MKKIKAFLPDKDSFYDDLVTMLMSLSSYTYTLHVAISSNNPRDFRERSFQEWLSYIEPLKRPNFPFSLDSKLLEKSYVFFPFWIISSISLNTWPQYLEYEFIKINKTPSPFKISSEGNSKIFSRMVGASFVNYYESQKENIDTKFGSNAKKWPDVVNLARNIRNGFSHGGHFYITNTSMKKLKWRKFELDYSMNGKKVLFTESGLGPGDIILLMDDLNKIL